MGVSVCVGVADGSAVAVSSGVGVSVGVGDGVEVAVEVGVLVGVGLTSAASTVFRDPANGDSPPGTKAMMAKTTQTNTNPSEDIPAIRPSRCQIGVVCRGRLMRGFFCAAA